MRNSSILQVQVVFGWSCQQPSLLDAKQPIKRTVRGERYPAGHYKRIQPRDDNNVMKNRTENRNTSAPSPAQTGGETLTATTNNKRTHPPTLQHYVSSLSFLLLWTLQSFVSLNIKSGDLKKRSKTETNTHLHGLLKLQLPQTFTDVK